MDYRRNLKKCLSEQNIDKLSTCQFIVNIIWEENKNHIDDIIYMDRYKVFNEQIQGRKFDLEVVLEILNCIANYYPLWIHVSELKENLFLIEYTSRYAKKEELCYQELGYPPFKFIDDDGR